MVLTRRVDDNWFEGRIANRKGIFPVSYVEVSCWLLFSPVNSSKIHLVHVPTHTYTQHIHSSSSSHFLHPVYKLLIIMAGNSFVWHIQVLTDIGSDALPVVPSKPIGAPAAHSLITSPNYQLSPRANYANDVTTSTNILSNGHHSPNVRDTKSVQKTEVLHVDTNTDPIPYVTSHIHVYIFIRFICHRP